jgi:hypothetical protein
MGPRDGAPARASPRIRTEPRRPLKIPSWRAAHRRTLRTAHETPRRDPLRCTCSSRGPAPDRAFHAERVPRRSGSLPPQRLAAKCCRASAADSGFFPRATANEPDRDERRPVRQPARKDPSPDQTRRSRRREAGAVLPTKPARILAGSFGGSSSRALLEYRVNPRSGLGARVAKRVRALPSKRAGSTAWRASMSHEGRPCQTLGTALYHPQ